MALTLIEELNMIKGSDGAKPDSADLRSLIYQSAVGESIRIFKDYKIAVSGSTEAIRYLNKMQIIGKNVFEKNDTTLIGLERIFVSLVGDTDVTYAQVLNANDSAWITFIQKNITTCFEVLGRVTVEEKNAYNSLPNNP